MTTVEALIAFTLAAGLVTLTPGLDTALVLRTAAVEGGRRAFLAGIGICAGCLAWGLIAAFGLGALLHIGGRLHGPAVGGGGLPALPSLAVS